MVILTLTVVAYVLLLILIREVQYRHKVSAILKRTNTDRQFICLECNQQHVVSSKSIELYSKKSFPKGPQIGWRQGYHDGWTYSPEKVTWKIPCPFCGRSTLSRPIERIFDRQQRGEYIQVVKMKNRIGYAAVLGSMFIVFLGLFIMFLVE